MEPATVELDITESYRRRVWRLAAEALGFQERQANFLAFWYWLARQRGETKHRLERSDSRLGVSNMQTSPDSLSKAAQNILDNITHTTPQLQLHKDDNWTAHLDRSVSTITLRSRNECEKNRNYSFC
jgi:hypothetical protein